MYLHIGNNRLIREKDIVGIFDMDSATVSKITRKWLSAAEKRGVLQTAGSELPKSVVLICGGDKNEKLCFSQLATKTLDGRSGKKDFK